MYLLDDFHFLFLNQVKSGVHYTTSISTHTLVSSEETHFMDGDILFAFRIHLHCTYVTVVACFPIDYSRMNEVVTVAMDTVYRHKLCADHSC